MTPDGLATCGKAKCRPSTQCIALGDLAFGWWVECQCGRSTRTLGSERAAKDVWNNNPPFKPGVRGGGNRET